MDLFRYNKKLDCIMSLMQDSQACITPNAVSVSKYREIHVGFSFIVKGLYIYTVKRIFKQYEKRSTAVLN